MTTLERIECFFPKELFGCIIGEQGARIKEMREKHSIKVFTDKDANRSGFRYCRYV